MEKGKNLGTCRTWASRASAHRGRNGNPFCKHESGQYREIAKRKNPEERTCSPILGKIPLKRKKQPATLRRTSRSLKGLKERKTIQAKNLCIQEKKKRPRTQNHDKHEEGK